jgi:NAD(P)-dependent dehydrogenase (short-subunit alcohol dehydrogenase family)
VNCFCPGKITTPMNAAAARIAASASSNIPNPCALGRDGRPGEVAKPIAFLLSDEST